MSSPTPYRQRFFELLSRTDAIDAYIYFCAPESPDRPWVLKPSEGIRGEAPTSWSIPIPWHWGARLIFNPGIVRAIARKDWDVVVVAGYNHPTMVAAIGVCLARRIPYILHGESHVVKPRPWILRALKRLFLFPVVRQCAAALATGTVARRYWKSVGIPEDHIFIVANTPDVEYFRRETDKLADQRCEIRKAWGVSEEHVLGVFVGRLAKVKGVDILLEGLARVAPERRPHLLVVGDGPQRAALEDFAKQNALPVRFHGFRQLDELPAVYAGADFFVLPSREEPWGVVVNEAMAAGLPVLLSDQVGAAYDLLEPGRNGFMVPTRSVEGWAKALETCVLRRENLKAMGGHSRRIIENWTHEKSVEQLLDAVKIAVKDRVGAVADEPGREARS